MTRFADAANICVMNMEASGDLRGFWLDAENYFVAIFSSPWLDRYFKDVGLGEPAEDAVRDSLNMRVYGTGFSGVTRAGNVLREYRQRLRQALVDAIGEGRSEIMDVYVGPDSTVNSATNLNVVSGRLLGQEQQFELYAIDGGDHPKTAQDVERLPRIRVESAWHDIGAGM